jgi:uncharacterized RDD family membrane protein YckC
MDPQNIPQVPQTPPINPAGPTSLPETANPNTMVSQTPALIPGGRWNRLIASLLDSFFLGLATLPLFLVSGIIIQGKISLDEFSINELEKKSLGYCCWAFNYRFIQDRSSIQK